MLCAGCLTTDVVTPRRCPQPNTVERDDYATIVEADRAGKSEREPDRPAVQWVARLIGYCWPDKAGEARNAPDPR